MGNGRVEGLAYFNCTKVSDTSVAPLEPNCIQTGMHGGA